MSKSGRGENPLATGPGSKRANDFFKDLLAMVNKDTQLTAKDPPDIWTTALAFTCNNYVRQSGLTPYQYITG